MPSSSLMNLRLLEALTRGWQESNLRLPFWRRESVPLDHTRKGVDSRTVGARQRGLYRPALVHRMLTRAA